MASKTICKIEGCGKPSHQMGMCCGHYKRWWRHGDPLAGRVSNGGPLQYLKDRVGSTETRCIPWPFRRYRVGYGKVLFEGRIWKAHRLMCVMAHGEPDHPKLDAAHNCGNHNCVNPNHLRWATRKENCADKINHGRTNRGARHGNVKLDESKVREIRRLVAGGMRNIDVAARFEISPVTVAHIKRRSRWEWLED
jgi:hypothetical protein